MVIGTERGIGLVCCITIHTKVLETGMDPSPPALIYVNYHVLETGMCRFLLSSTHRLNSLYLRRRA